MLFSGQCCLGKGVLKMRNIYALVLVLVSTVVAFGQKPLLADFCTNSTEVDRTWAWGLFGHTQVTGHPSASPEVASQELYKFTSAMRGWTISEANRYWFASWRIAKIQKHFLDQADYLQHAVEVTWVAAKPAEKAYALRLAVMYRQISDLLALRKLVGAESFEKKLLTTLDEVTDLEMKVLQERSKPSPKVLASERGFFALAFAK